MILKMANYELKKKTANYEFKKNYKLEAGIVSTTLYNNEIKRDGFGHAEIHFFI
jgi:hypothetical protein